jgi:hypothetical protein
MYPDSSPSLYSAHVGAGLPRPSLTGRGAWPPGPGVVPRGWGIPRPPFLCCGAGGRDLLCAPRAGAGLGAVWAGWRPRPSTAARGAAERGAGPAVASCVGAADCCELLGASSVRAGGAVPATASPRGDGGGAAASCSEGLPAGRLAAAAAADATACEPWRSFPAAFTPRRVLGGGPSARSGCARPTRGDGASPVGTRFTSSGSDMVRSAKSGARTDDVDCADCCGAWMSAAKSAARGAANRSLLDEGEASRVAEARREVGATRTTRTKRSSRTIRGTIRCERRKRCERNVRHVRTCAPARGSGQGHPREAIRGLSDTYVREEPLAVASPILRQMGSRSGRRRVHWSQSPKRVSQQRLEEYIGVDRRSEYLNNDSKEERSSGEVSMPKRKWGVLCRFHIEIWVC